MKESASTNSFEHLRFEFRNYFGFRPAFVENSAGKISHFGFKKDNVPWCLGGKGFTLIELVVAVALLVMVLGLAGVIFQSSIGSYRVALAQAEIMQKLRVITEQLDSDFKGLRKDAPMFIWFQLDPNDPNNRLDQIMFFADGDFQSVKNTIAGNVARIQYGQAMRMEPNGAVINPVNIRDSSRILANRRHILTADKSIADYWPSDFNTFGVFDPNTSSPSLLKNDTYEFDWLSLSEWQAIVNDSIPPLNVDRIITICFYNRPAVNTSDANTLHLLMLEGVGSFSVQWGYYATLPGPPPLSTWLWWPSTDPDGNGNFIDSDFGTSGMNLNSFGFYFNSATPAGWFSPTGVSPDGPKGSYYPAVKPAYLKAFKFTFTLYDSKGIFKAGQTFTHIVYLGD